MYFMLRLSILVRTAMFFLVSHTVVRIQISKECLTFFTLLNMIDTDIELNQRKGKIPCPSNQTVMHVPYKGTGS